MQETTTPFATSQEPPYYSSWKLRPCPENPARFHIFNSKGDEICTLTFPGQPDIDCLSIIAVAPRLRNLLEFFHEHLTDLEETARKKNLEGLIEQANSYYP